MPLSMLSTGDSAIVEKVRGGHGMRRRLTSMGIVPGVEITMVRGGSSGGPIIVSIGGGRFGLGRGMAHRIIVSPAN